MTINLAITSTRVKRGSEIQTINARDLHRELEVGRDFSTWIKSRIEKYGFEKNVDYLTVQNLISPDLGRSKSRHRKVTDYHLSLDMAKELAMLENNDIGRQVRRYFIQIEKERREERQRQELRNDVRRMYVDLHEFISELDGSPNQKKHAHSNVTNLIYRHLTNGAAPSAITLRKIYDVDKKETPRNKMELNTLYQLHNTERQILKLAKSNQIKTIDELKPVIEEVCNRITGALGMAILEDKSCCNLEKFGKKAANDKRSPVVSINTAKNTLLELKVHLS